MTTQSPDAPTPAISIIARNLPAMTEIVTACEQGDHYPESAIADGLRHLLADLVQHYTEPDTPEWNAAQEVLKWSEPPVETADE